MHYPRLRYYNDRGTEIASDSVLIRFFMQWTHQEIGSAVMYALDLFRDRIRPYQLDWYIDHEGYTEQLNDSRWDGLREEMLRPRESLVVRLASGSKRYGVFTVDYRGLQIPSPWPHRKNDSSVLHLCLPTEYLEERGSAHLRELALALAEELPFNSGYAALAFSHGGPDEAVDLVRTRYRGLHLASESPQLDMGTRVDGVHWLNFLGQPVLGQLGGATGLRERLTHPGISLHEMRGERVLISLGEEPSVGDVEAGETLPMHRELARLLEPHLYHYKMPFGRMSPEEQLQWERRFLRET